jgi:hypothetical protein
MSGTPWRQSRAYTVAVRCEAHLKERFEMVEVVHKIL